MPITPNPKIQYEPNPVRIRQQWINGSSAGPITDYPWSGTIPTTYVAQWSGVRTPNYWVLKRERKKLPENNYSLEIRVWSSRPRLAESYTYDVGYTNRYTEYWGSSWNTFFSQPAAFHDGFVDQLARRRLAKKASGVSVNLAQAFAERRQTANMITDTAWRVANAARELRKGNLYGAYTYLGVRKKPSAAHVRSVQQTKAKDRLANHWLELQYGWLPLLSDVHGAAELLAKHIETDPYHSELTASAKTEYLIRDYTKELFTIKQGNQILKSQTRYKICVSLDDISRSILAETGITNPMLLAWELIPYSFVVDWFIPVGNYLEMLKAYDGWKFYSGIKTQKSSIRLFWDENHTRTIVNSKTSGSISSWIGGAKGTAFLMNRTVLSGFPEAQFGRLKSPAEALNPIRMANALALLNQLFKR